MKIIKKLFEASCLAPLGKLKDLFLREDATSVVFGFVSYTQNTEEDFEWKSNKFGSATANCR